MSKDWYQDIVDFHREVIQANDPLYPQNNCPVTPLRISLINEEIKETFAALSHGDLVELTDGIVDSIVVLIGTAVSFGIDLRPIWDEVHRTNMLKKGGEVRADGKRLKPKGWKPPRIKELLERQINKGEILKGVKS